MNSMWYMKTETIKQVNKIDKKRIEIWQFYSNWKMFRLFQWVQYTKLAQPKQRPIILRADPFSVSAVSSSPNKAHYLNVRDKDPITAVER